MGVRVSPFRAMTLSDVPEVLALEQLVFPAPWTEKMLRDEVRAKGRVYLLTSDDDGVAAYGGIMVVEADAHIMTLAVREDRRRTGLASRLRRKGLRIGAVDATTLRAVTHRDVSPADVDAAIEILKASA